ncbi:hypothetical protein DPMN_181181 [Dreissena polymorpha]|uniref:Uncharacterized protein n=1 Tax=Dreissena polymorpha TaxID=45954 RepID=A0A9D4DDZ2_DREPO|nr:hypothetical protein DPMN_181181 [Dreissena polymorpha]
MCGGGTGSSGGGGFEVCGDAGELGVGGYVGIGGGAKEDGVGCGGAVVSEILAEVLIK